MRLKTPPPLHAGRGSGMTQLPPGQRRVDGFPRFGGPFKPLRQCRSIPAVEITGAVREPITVALSSCSPSRARNGRPTSIASQGGRRPDCVGRALGSTFFRSIIEPRLSPTTAVTHVVFRGLDGYRAIVHIEDALQNDVLLADRLDDEPLSLAHGAPLRLVSPQRATATSAQSICAPLRCLAGAADTARLRPVPPASTRPGLERGTQRRAPDHGRTPDLPIPYPAVHVAQHSGKLELALGRWIAHLVAMRT